MKEIAGGIGAVPGIRTAGINCGIKSNGKKDLALIYSSAPANTVGLFTRNRVKAAPVLFCQQHLPSPQIQAVLINSGNANACTGEDGLNKVSHLTAALAQELDLPPAAVLMASTGVIGESLPAKKIETALPALVQQLTPHDNQAEAASKAAAQAILTTDTVTKQTAVKLNIRGQAIIIGGIAKGSGMICPKLATMLAFLATDLQLQTTAMEQALKSAVRKSFEQISVDGDMSTNDTVLLMATGVSKVILQPDDEDWALFQEGLNYVCRQLAKMIIKDGEGATKVIEVRVQQAATETDARRIALQVANSNLVKTAIFAADANWGRIMAAAGAAGVAFDPQRVDVLIGDILLVKNGVGLGKEAEKQAQPLLQQPEIKISIVLNQGQAQAAIWGNDLSYDYVKINAEYRS